MVVLVTTVFQTTCLLSLDKPWHDYCLRVTRARLISLGMFRHVDFDMHSYRQNGIMTFV